VANILYSLLMLETGYINGVLEKKEIDNSIWKRKDKKLQILWNKVNIKRH
jgi:hypothetical protein